MRQVPGRYTEGAHPGKAPVRYQGKIRIGVRFISFPMGEAQGYGPATRDPGPPRAFRHLGTLLALARSPHGGRRLTPFI